MRPPSCAALDLREPERLGIMDDAVQVAGGLLVYDDGAHGAFFHALAALDARVLVHDGGGTADDVEHALGARINADTATGTLVSINLWSCHSLRFLPVSRALPYARLIAGLKITVTPCLRNRYFAGSILRHCCGVVIVAGVGSPWLWICSGVSGDGVGSRRS